MPSSDSAVRCHELKKTFQQGDSAIIGLDQVTLEIPKGDFICLSGPSGSGKSTLLNAIGALDQSDSGTVQIDGNSIDQLSRSQLAELRLNHIGFVFQSYNLIPVLSARENVEFVMEMQGIPSKERHRLSSQILREVGLRGAENRRPAQLSGGQQQRVAVARAIVSNPSLILADEPTANLDSETAEQLMQLFLQLNHDHGTTFVIATHDPRVMSYAKRQIKMCDGKIISDSAANDARQSNG